MRRVVITGAAALSAAGSSWKSLAGAVRQRMCLARPGHPLGPPGNVPAAAVALSALPPVAPPKQRRLMARAAELAAVAMTGALRDAGVADGSAADVGVFLGVGASGASMDEITGMLDVSCDGDDLSMARLGTDGMAACHPFHAFHLLNNFTMCHGAICTGTGGSNATFFSRGTGTVIALDEAVYAVASGACDRALCGGADTALHPVTWAELVRAGLADRGLVPGEGAAVLALAAEGAAGHSAAAIDAAQGQAQPDGSRATAEGAAGHGAAATGAAQGQAQPDGSRGTGATGATLAVIDRCRVHVRAPGRAGHTPDLGDQIRAGIDAVRGWRPEGSGAPIDAVVIAAFCPELDTALGDAAASVHPGAEILWTGPVVGETLAAAPALAWVCGLAVLHAAGDAAKRAARDGAGRPRRVRVLSAGPDGDIGEVILAAKDEA